MAANQENYLVVTSWSVTRYADLAEIGAIYYNGENPIRAYMATNGVQWSHEPTLLAAYCWVASHPKQEPPKRPGFAPSAGVTLEVPWEGHDGLEDQANDATTWEELGQPADSGKPPAAASC
jgi:hypothetical protein